MSRPVVDASPSCSLPNLLPAAERRVLAARFLESTLLRLGRAGVVIDRRLHPGLSRMHRLRLYTHVGYVRLGDYLTERLGMSLRRCQSILRLDRALAPLPLLAEAFESGEISISRIEVAAAAATPETEALWLDRARCLPLPVLRKAARAAASNAAGTAVNEAAREAADGAPGSDTGAPARAANEPLRIEQDDPGRVISFSAPAPVVAVWHWTLDLVRRVAGQQEPAWRCAEYLAAEFLSGAPDTGGESSHGPSDRASRPADSPPAAADSAPVPADSTPTPADSPSAVPTESGDAPSTPRRSIHPAASVSDDAGMAAWIDAAAAVRDALASFGSSADPEVILSERPLCSEHDSEADSHPDDDLDAWDLDAHLRRLVRLRQSLAWRQGRLLAAMARLCAHRDLGFDTFDDWVEDRLAMSPRRARYLVSLDRRLCDLPLLADAYRRGLLSWCQARLLIRVVRPQTQSRWIRYARQVTVRRLGDVIIECEVSAAESPATPAPFAPAHISASPLPPAEPPPAPMPPASASPDPASRHASAPLLDLASMKPVSFSLMPRRQLSFWCPLDVASLWDSALRACRSAAGSNLEDWECFPLFVQAMRETWENQEDPHWRRRYRIFERDGWRCKAPGCTSRSGLNEHHVTFRSQLGDDDETNLVALCVGHHQEGLHKSYIRCFGIAPDALWWDLGARPGREPLARYFGDRLVKRRPFIPVGHAVAPGECSVARPSRVASAATSPPRFTTSVAAGG